MSTITIHAEDCRPSFLMCAGILSRAAADELRAVQADFSRIDEDMWKGIPGSKVVRDRKIPFELSADPFYCESNMRYLAESAAAARAGHVTEHELVKP